MNVRKREKRGIDPEHEYRGRQKTGKAPGPAGCSLRAVSGARHRQDQRRGHHLPGQGGQRHVLPVFSGQRCGDAGPAGAGELPAAEQCMRGCGAADRPGDVPGQDGGRDRPYYRSAAAGHGGAQIPGAQLRVAGAGPDRGQPRRRAADAQAAQRGADQPGNGRPHRAGGLSAHHGAGQHVHVGVLLQHSGGQAGQHRQHETGAVRHHPQGAVRNFQRKLQKALQFVQSCGKLSKSI